MSKRNKKNRNDDFDDEDDVNVKATSVSNKDNKSKGKKGKNKKNVSDDEEDFDVKVEVNADVKISDDNVKKQVSQVKEAKSKLKKGKSKKDQWSDNEEEDKVLLKLDEVSSDELQPTLIKKNQKKCKFLWKCISDCSNDLLILAKTKKKKQQGEEIEDSDVDAASDTETKTKSPEVNNVEANVADLAEEVNNLQVDDVKPDAKKMTHKEKKKLKKLQEYERQMETLLKKGGQGHSELETNFTVSQTHKSAAQMAALENAIDIKIENFSISAKGNELFVNANLLIANGRHYGLVGPNGSVLLFKYTHDD